MVWTSPDGLVRNSIVSGMPAVARRSASAGRWCSEAPGAGAGGPAAAEPLRSRACRSSTMPRAVTASRRPAIGSRTIPKTRYRVQNWPAYEAGLKRRGDLTLWLDEAALARWQAPRRTTPGGQARYSDAAIELVLMLRFVFHLALRQTEGFTASILRLLGQEQRVPDHTTLSRRSRGFAGRRPKVIPHGPVHLVIDSTGLKLFGQGEWIEEKHGRATRSWRKLHLAVESAAARWRGRRTPLSVRDTASSGPPP